MAPLGMLASFLVVVQAVAYPTWAEWAPGALAITGGVAFLALLGMIRHPTREARPLESAGVTVFAVVYLGVPLGFAVLLRASASEPWLGALLLIFPMAVAWAGDAAAFFGGRRWGRKKLAPAVSPGKTVVGSVSGLVGSVVMGILIVFLTSLWVPGFPIGYVGAVILAIAIGTLSQFGDLAESALKRSVGVKDSGFFLPGHGGVLDRFDGVLLTLPATYLVLSLLGIIG
jgi:phosphatidate cytidylyltransferase